jgi:hypothetical protein
MEFDSTMYSLRNKKTLRTSLTQHTYSLLEQFANFHAVPVEQVVETALGRLVASDPDFVAFLQDPSRIK